MITYEVVLEDVAGVLAAEAGGASRVELCSALVIGGITPSIGIVEEAVRRRKHIPIMVMVRPRGGDFLYTEEEFASMLEDIDAIKKTGAEGVVFGVLLADGTFDVDRMQQLVDRARPMRITCHRAFDMTVDPIASLDVLMSLGIERVLTSGHEKSAHAGADCLRKLVAHGKDRITILAGGGLRREDVLSLIETSGVTEVHGSAFAKTQSAMAYRNPRLSMGKPDSDEYALQVTDAKIVRKMVEVLGRV